MARDPARRTTLVDAAIEVLALEGTRGLTFRAVDARAGCPAGTASNYFSGRDDPLTQAGRHIHVRMTPDPARIAEAMRPALRAEPTTAVRAAPDDSIRFHLDAGLPGDADDVLVLCLAMTGLLLEVLTLPGGGALTGRTEHAGGEDRHPLTATGGRPRSRCATGSRHMGHMRGPPGRSTVRPVKAKPRRSYSLLLRALLASR